MTAQRQENKGWNPGIACLATFASLWLIILCPQVQAAATERVVVNRHTGLAIDGFDPVAYFTEAGATKGAANIEVANSGAIWRFQNVANRAIFVAYPDVYAPQFGGYDPTDVARGKAVAGRAQLWLITGKRLYLFSREESRDAFAADPAVVLRQATEEWPALLDTLSDY